MCELASIKFQIGDLDPRALPSTWRSVLRADPCVYCGGAAEGLDHIEAASLGGHDGWTNRAPACGRCDGAKGAASVLVFLVARLEAQRDTARRRYQTDAHRDAAVRAKIRNATKVAAAPDSAFGRRVKARWLNWSERQAPPLLVALGAVVSARQQS